MMRRRGGSLERLGDSEKENTQPRCITDRLYEYVDYIDDTDEYKTIQEMSESRISTEWQPIARKIPTSYPTTEITDGVDGLFSASFRLCHHAMLNCPSAVIGSMSSSAATVSYARSNQLTDNTQTYLPDPPSATPPPGAATASSNSCCARASASKARQTASSRRRRTADCRCHMAAGSPR